jgi:hypothetical protein
LHAGGSATLEHSLSDAHMRHVPAAVLQIGVLPPH